MNDNDNSNNKTFRVRDGAETNHQNPIKKCHILDGKYFVLIDWSIIEKLKLLGIDETELYFQQELKQGSIILHPLEIGK
jgi:hypothetical protein